MLFIDKVRDVVGLYLDPPERALVLCVDEKWRIEHDYREMKQALGLAHFEGRTWRGWHHHVTLVSVAHAFCTLQRITRSPKRRRRPEPLPGHPRTAVTPRGLDRRLPHLSSQHARTHTNLTKPY
jgi:hypothetical protein